MSNLVDKIKGLINKVKADEDVKLASEELKDEEYKCKECGSVETIDIGFLKDLDLDKNNFLCDKCIEKHKKERKQIKEIEEKKRKEEQKRDPLGLENPNLASIENTPPLSSYTNHRDKIILARMEAKKAEVIKEVPSDSVQNEPIDMGGEPEKVKKFKKDQKNDKDGNKPDAVVSEEKEVNEKKESVVKKSTEEVHNIAFDKIIDEIKNGVSVDVAVDNVKNKMGVEPVVIDQTQEPLIVKQENIKQKCGSYNIIQKDNGEVVCLRDDEIKISK